MAEYFLKMQKKFQMWQTHMEKNSLHCIILPAQNHEKLDSAVVTDYRPRSDRKTQTSMIKIDRKDFKFKSVLSSPDVIKTLQMLPGVTPGNEMSTTGRSSR